jgi:hypothetical protein
VILIATAVVACITGIAIGIVIATPTRELTTTGPHTRLGQGDYTTDIFA